MESVPTCHRFTAFTNMKTLALISALAALGLASPTPVADTQYPRQTCVVPYANGGDDTPAIHAAGAKCSSNAVIKFEAGVD
jgi:hypothetical protein